MKQGYHISINQFAEYSAAKTAKAKARIIKQQLIPNKVLIPWYQSAKGSIKKYLENVYDNKPLEDGILKVNQKTPENKRQVSDKFVSLQALQKVMELQIARLFAGLEYAVIKPKLKSVSIRLVQVGISPDLVFKAKVNDQIVLGAIKIHISKNKPFSTIQCEYVSTVLLNYLKKHVAEENEVVLPSLCLCIDVFANRIVSAKDDAKKTLKEVKAICDEIKNNWPSNPQA